MPIMVVTNELPRAVRKDVAETISSTLAGADGDWKVSLMSDGKNNAWDVEVSGPDNFHWARRFSGADRDADLINEAIRSALIEAGKELLDPVSEGLNEALSSLAIQGIAFTSEPTRADQRGERKYVVDRVQLKESEIVYLHNQGALTTNGIRRYLLTRGAA
jgi:hypothetical protein